jgi:L-ascorbate metabolism protein UlaG (beta-lactamase superfamily)
MIITWFGQSFFKIETQNKVIAIDPYDENYTGLKPSRFKADILLVSHQHQDHNNTKLILGEPFLLDSPGEIEIDGIFVEGIETFHDNNNGATLGKNTIFLIKSEGLNIVHLGDLGEKKLKEELLETLGAVDILFIPVGGKYTINYSEAVNIVSQIEPNFVIPMHYKIDGLKIDLDGIDKFTKEFGLTPEILDKFVIRKSNIPEEQDTKLIILQKQ